MADIEVIESKLNFLREYLGDLKEYETISLQAYRKNKKDQRFVERTLHLACECCLDIAAHIISRRGFREPKDNKDLFMALFENSIVHYYTRIDPEVVVSILQRNIKDFKTFSREILQNLK